MNRNIIIFFLLLLTVAVASCSKWDEYKQYTENGETRYVGKMDLVETFSGRLRIKMTALLPADPRITKTKITWNFGNDSVVFPISKGSGADTFKQIINITEGVVSFNIVNYDAEGNRSMTETVSGTSYGSKYESGLTNRPITRAELLPNGTTEVVWDSFDSTSGAKGAWLIYTTTGNKADSVYVPIRTTGTTTIPNLKLGTLLTERTLYLPTSTCIDTFYAAAQTIPVKSDVTSLYLSNTGPGFQRGTYDGNRWGTLGTPWNTNAAAKNKSGYGGYSADEGGVINWETWNNSPVIDGIVYQVTSAPLPAGTYTVSFTEYSEIQANSSVYCVAAAGSNGIPVLANLTTALGSVALYNGATIGATSPSQSDTRSFSFTISAPQYVSLGFLGNIVGSGNPGSYFQVKKIQLYSN
ncbi:protein of unknown function [Filimonas lacunae]|uniref:DUF5013 domain-containing protein n=1 Tax=Filimonas lacunae TaxID=477680 RepID=A0A173MBE8_9BACT|nr:DUF4998 domain-containing protein [Filimonas lacunae]BAV04856.1 hypothetical protein FLA_0856 [Filimonas lacunae]SIT34662.1 protein of unknown function [Filimonas lacunae]